MKNRSQRLKSSPLTDKDTDKDDANIQIEPQSKPIETASITVIDPVTNKVETLQEVIEQEVLRFQDQKRHALKAQITELEQRLANQNTLEKQFVEQNQYVQTIKVQQEQQAEKIAELEQIKQEAQEYKLQQSEKIAELEQTGQATQEYTLQQSDLYDQKIAELEQNLQQQQQSEQAAKEYANQQQKVAEKTIQENAELQEKQAQQQAKIEAYQAQLTQAETKQVELKSEAKQPDENQLDQQNKTLNQTQTIESDNQNYTHHIEPNNQNNNPFIQAEFPISAPSQLHVSPYIIDAVTTSLSDTSIDQGDHNQPESDIDQTDDNQSEFNINPTDHHQAVPKFDLENIHYADNIPPELQKDLAKLLPETGQHAQKLLDIFSAQLSNPNQSIQNPIVDFAHLVQRLQTGELDIEDTETLIARARGDKTPKQHEFDRLFGELEAVRHTADLNKQHYLDYYQHEAQANHMSVEQYIEDQDQMDFWQELCSTLKQSEYAIRDLMAQNI